MPVGGTNMLGTLRIQLTEPGVATVSAQFGDDVCVALRHSAR